MSATLARGAGQNSVSTKLGLCDAVIGRLSELPMVVQVMSFAGLGERGAHVIGKPFRTPAGCLCQTCLRMMYMLHYGVCTGQLRPLQSPLAGWP